MDQASAPSDSPGDAPAEEFPRAFGAYVLLREVGSGGMGRVYAARHVRRGRVEALKVLRSQFAVSPKSARRFEREVRAIAQVSHDHIVTLYDSGIVGGELFYTMPLLPGPSLEGLIAGLKVSGEAAPGLKALALLDEHGFPHVPAPHGSPEGVYARRVAAALVGVSDALAALHKAGVIHRDVKPSNLLISEQGRALLADFGIARTADQKLTETGQFLGTPAYMSPEQILERGRDLDGRSDIYALGATLFELLTLRQPHEGENLAETMALILKKRARPVRALNPRIPADLDTVVSRCLERSPADRYADAGALRDDLQRFASGEPVVAKPLSRVTRTVRYLQRHAVPLGAAALLLGALLAWYFTRPGRIDVHSTPVAELLVDDARAGPTPLVGHELPPGRHELLLVRDRYAPYAKTVVVQRNSTYALDVMLQALDPASHEARALAAGAFGLKRSGESVAVQRGAADAPNFEVLWPRGAVRGAPSELQFSAMLADVASVELRERAPGNGRAARTLHRWPEVEASGELVTLDLPAALRAELQFGGEYELYVDGDEFEAHTARFRILASEAGSQVQTWLGKAKERFLASDRSYDFVAAEYLLARELYREALEIVTALQEPLGERKEIARLALEILHRADVQTAHLLAVWERRFGTWPD